MTIAPFTQCSCGDLVKEIDTLFCNHCGDVTCMDCLSESEEGRIYCVNCEGVNNTDNMGRVLTYLMIDGKKYFVAPSSQLLYLSSYEHGYTSKLFMDIKGIGMLKFLYRSVVPMYNNEDLEVGDLYTIYFERTK